MGADNDAAQIVYHVAQVFDAPLVAVFQFCVQVFRFQAQQQVIFAVAAHVGVLNAEKNIQSDGVARFFRRLIAQQVGVHFFFLVVLFPGVDPLGEGVDAQTAAGEVKQYIPAHVATDFNGTGIATAKLENVEVTDGTINIGMAKDKPYTNWHVVQIKGVTARVDAAGLLAIAVAAAEAIEEASVPAALYSELTETLTTYDKIYETADDYQTAIDAIEAVVAKAEAYAPLTAVLAQGDIYKSHVAEGDAAIATYEEAIADVAAAYATVSVADIPAAIAVVLCPLWQRLRRLTAPI